MSQERELVDDMRFHEVNMRGTRLRSTGKSVVAILCAACFLTTSLGSVSRAVAADAWETWPKKTTVPGWRRIGNGAAVRSDQGRRKRRGEETAKGRSSGTIGWIAAGIAVVIGIGIAIAAGGGGDGGGGSG